MQLRAKIAVVLLLAGIVPLAVFLVAMASQHAGEIPVRNAELLVAGILVGIVVITITIGADLLVARPAARLVEHLTELSRRAPPETQKHRLMEELAPTVKSVDATANQVSRLSETIQTVIGRLEQSESLARDQVSQLERELEQAKQKLAALATHDNLTGLSNARHFRERLEEEMKRSARSGRPLSVLLMDVDRLRHLNEAHGRDAGDAVLRRIARVLTDTVRATDIVARYGGEEMAVVLLEATGADAYTLAERIKQLVVAETFDFGGDEYHITVSIGLAATDVAVVGSAQELLDRAEQGLNKAKAAGTNRVEAA